MGILFSIKMSQVSKKKGTYCAKISLPTDIVHNLPFRSVYTSVELSSIPHFCWVFPKAYVQLLVLLKAYLS